MVSQSSTTTNYTGATGTASPSTTTVVTSNAYLLFDAAQQASIATTYSGAQTGTTTSTFSYDHNGHVAQVSTFPNFGDSEASRVSWRLFGLSHATISRFSMAA